MPPMQKHKHYSIKSKIHEKFGDFTSLQTRNEIYDNKIEEEEEEDEMTWAEFKDMKHS
jgi:hypothetical protein